MGKGVKSAGKLGKPRESSISGVSKSGRDAQKRTISKQLKPQKSLTGCTASNKAFVDQLFASKKPSKRSIAGSEGGDSHGEGTGAGRVQPGKAVKPAGNKDDLFGTGAAARPKTEEGWNVYTEDEVKWNKGGGGTDLCPFDCNCCF